MITKKIFFLFILLPISLLFSQQYLNLDFEFSDSNSVPLGWRCRGIGYELKVDSSIFYSGRKCLKIKKIDKGSYGSATTTFPLQDAIGKHIRIKGFIKTDGITNGYAGLWYRVDGKDVNRPLAFDNMASYSVKGTTNWEQYSIDVNVDTTAQNIVFGAILSGAC